ncbi:hypothetical protein PIB30_105432, partial [Stylosanthes scabra]|nr:hypothetical protein [Stylosanthes scabra]
GYEILASTIAFPLLFLAALEEDAICKIRNSENSELSNTKLKSLLVPKQEKLRKQRRDSRKEITEWKLSSVYREGMQRNANDAKWNEQNATE